MDKKKLNEIIRNWEEKYLDIIKEKYRKYKEDDLRSQMKRLEGMYDEKRLATFDKEFMVNSLANNYNDNFRNSALTILDNIQSGKNDVLISKSVSNLIELISSAKQEENVNELNLELVDELEDYKSK